MSEGVEQEVVLRPGSGDDEGETNTENAGSTPLPPSAREEEQEEMKVNFAYDLFCYFCTLSGQIAIVVTQIQDILC